MLRRTFQPAWNEIRDASKAAKEKVVDKALGLTYTIRTGCEGRLIAANSRDIKRSGDIEKVIRAFGAVAEEAVEKIYPGLPAPIIAGGCVRDMVFGDFINDIDVFVDLSTVPEDDMDDVCLLITASMKDAGAALKDLTIQPDGENQYEAGPESASGFVCGYESTLEAVRFQILGRLEGPEETIEKFDYSLVKCYYDSGAKQFTFHEEFLKQLDKKELVVTSEKTNSRVNRWIDRNSYYEKFTTKRTYKSNSLKFYNVDFTTTATAGDLIIGNFNAN